MQSKVVSTGPKTLMERAFSIMRNGEFRHLPIVDERGALIGVVSDRDLLGVGMLKRNEASGDEELVTGASVTVDTIMVTPPVTIAPDSSVSKAVKVIRDRRTGCLIVCIAGRVVGIVNRNFKGPFDVESEVSNGRPTKLG